MTLTSIMPSLRASIPDPIVADSWPVATRPTVADVLVGGVSLRHLASLCHTPCVHVADAVVPGTHGRPATGAATTVVVMTVTSVRLVDGRIELTTDGDPEQALWSEARLIGRASTARRVPVTVQGAERAVCLGAPSDVRVGDLLAVPCRGALTLRDVHAASHHARFVA